MLFILPTIPLEPDLRALSGWGLCLPVGDPKGRPYALSRYLNSSETRTGQLGYCCYMRP